MPDFNEMMQTIGAFLEADRLDIAGVGPTTKIVDLGLDSLELVSGMVALESRYGVFLWPDLDEPPPDATLGDLHRELGVRLSSD